MARGGARPNSGPQPGLKYKRMTTAVEISMDGKLQPLTVIVSAMREAWERHCLPKENLEELIEKLRAGEFDKLEPAAIQKKFWNAALALLNWEKVAVDYAERAAPYLHNKLQSVDHNMAMAVLHSLDGTDDTKSLIEKLAAKRAAISDPSAAEQVAKLLEFKRTGDKADLVEENE